MIKVLCSPLLRIFALILAALVIASLLVPSQFVGGTLFIIRAALAILFAALCVPVVLDALRSKNLRPAHIMGVGQFIFVGAIALSSMWGLSGLLWHFPTSMRDSSTTAVLAGVSTVGLALMVLSPTFEPPLTNLRNWWPVAIVAAVGLFVSGLLIGAGVRL